MSHYIPHAIFACIFNTSVVHATLIPASNNELADTQLLALANTQINAAANNTEVINVNEIWFNDAINQNSSNQIQTTLNTLKKHIQFEIDPINAKDISINMTSLNHFSLKINASQQFTLNKVALIPSIANTQFGLSAEKIILSNADLNLNKQSVGNLPVLNTGFNALIQLNMSPSAINGVITGFGSQNLGANIMLTAVKVGDIQTSAAAIGDIEVSQLRLVGTKFNIYY